ncbi:Gfo/Idh/MocA family protein [Sunxiuqinia sp. A32]|uniref:Gfo/Idh/MocA family protein n=1 Tax=Sunxiuqinia sp. A32 TaxID=3461496 RepID=UPI0040457E6D
MKKIKYGMIGGGIGAFIGDAHRRAARLCNDFELVGGVFDVDYERSKEFALQEDIALGRCYESVDLLIEKELQLAEDQRMKVVTIVTPNTLHFPFAKKLLNSGFHVICEKPMTITVEEAVELESLVIEKQLTFALTHTYTGYPMVRQMRDLISEGHIGIVQRVDAQYYQGWVNNIIHSSENRIGKFWKLDSRQTGISGCLGDIGVHAFNLAEYVTGKQVKEVLSDLNTLKEEIELDVDGTVLLRFGDNLKGVIRASQVCAGEENNLSIGVYGSKGSLTWSQENPNFLTLKTLTEPIRIYKPAHTYNGDFAERSHTMKAGHPEGYYEALANIYVGVRKSIKGEEINAGEYPTVHDGVRGMKFIHAVVNSHKTGNSWISINQ